ncbi:hypothetical protein Tco_1509406 [Tanacetum coccineum]
MHMLTKPQVFYDDTHKQALGYQNLFHLKKAHQIQPTLYDGSVIAKEHVVISMTGDEETLILEEENRSKMLDKQNDLILTEKKIKISPIDYSKLNKIKEDFGKCFVTQKELYAEQDFWLKHSSFSETPVTSHTPVRIEAPSKLPKLSHKKKDTVIRKLKDRIKYKSGKDSLEDIKKGIDETKTINIELEHNLNAQLQKKGFAITTLKNKLRKLKGKNVVDTAVSKPNATIALGMFKLDIEPISPRLKNNRDAHEVYIEKTIEYTNTLCGFVERARTPNPNEPLLESACMFTKHVQKFNIPKQTDSLKTKDSNKPLFTSTEVKHTTSASGSKPLSNTKNNRITRPLSSNQKNKVKDHSRKVKSSLNKMNSISELVSNALVKHSMRNAKFESIYAICRTFTIVENMCPLTRITSTKVVPPKETTIASVVRPTSGILVYSRRPKATRSVGSSSKVKIVESKTSNSKEPKQSWGSTVSDFPSVSLNDCRLSKIFSGIWTLATQSK